jgi:hypothetical protein
LEPGERLYASPLAGSHEAAQHRRRFAALIAAKEGPVAAANRDAADGALCCVPFFSLSPTNYRAGYSWFIIRT